MALDRSTARTGAGDDAPGGRLQGGAIKVRWRSIELSGGDLSPSANGFESSGLGPRAKLASSRPLYARP